MKREKEKEKKPDPGSPFAKLQAVKEKLAAEEAAAKVAKAAKSAGVASSKGGGAGSTTSGPSMREAMAARITSGMGGGSPAKTRAEKVTAEEDAVAFHRLVSGVTPLGTPSKRVPRSQQSADVEAAAEQAKKRASVRETAEAEAQAVDTS